MNYQRHTSTRKQQTHKTYSGTLLKIGVVLVILTLAFGNIIIFSKSVKLSDNLVTLENDTKKTKKENVELEKKLYTQHSMENLEIMAKQLGFIKNAEPVLLEEPPYALVQ